MTTSAHFVSAHADHRPDYRFTRQRQDRLYTPLAQSEPPLRAWGPHVAAAIGIVLLGTLAFPVLQILADLIAQ